MTDRQIFPGRVVRLNATDYIVPALALGTLKQNLPKLTAIMQHTGMPTLELIDNVLDVGLAALRRNYPELTREQLEEWVDAGNMGEVIQAIAGVRADREGTATPAGLSVGSAIADPVPAGGSVGAAMIAGGHAQGEAIASATAVTGPSEPAA